MKTLQRNQITKLRVLQNISQILIGLVLVFMLPAAYAHKSSTAYLTIDAQQNLVEIKADIAIRDILNVVDVDINFDNQLSWGELKGARQSIFDYFINSFKLQTDNQICPLQSSDFKLDQHSDGAYLVLYLTAQCNQEMKSLAIDYTLFSGVDTQHRAMMKLLTKTGARGYALSAEKSKIVINLEKRDNFVTFIQYIEEGVTHIFAGLDHILFLLSLLLPVVLVRSKGVWEGVSDYRETVIDVVKVVTAFTVAHSITFGIVLVKNISLQVNWVEGIIAFSVIIAALNNLVPVVSGRRWLIGFVFGLIHGLGFASVFVDSGLMVGSTIISLVGFNLGVEIGQLLIVAALLPIAYLARHGWIYQQVVLKVGSMSIIMIGIYWLVERTMMV